MLFATRDVVARLNVDTGVVRILFYTEHTVGRVVVVGQLFDSFADHTEVAVGNTLGVEVVDKQLLETAFANTFLYAVVVSLLELGNFLGDVVEVGEVDLVGVDGARGEDRNSSHIC